MTMPRRMILPLILFLLPLAGSAQTPSQPADNTPPPTTPSGKTDGTAPAKPAAGNPVPGTKTTGSESQDREGTAQASIEKICVGTATEIGIDAEPHTVRLGDWLTLDVKGIETLGARAKKDKKSLQLYLNGLPLAGVPAIDYQPSGQEPGCLEKSPGYPLVRFHLVRNDESKDTWSLLLGRAGSKNRKVEVSVGIAGCSEGCTDISTPLPISLVVIRPAWHKWFWVVLVLLLISLLLLAYFTALLHDHGIDSGWSLGRSQMAWWFFFVISAFLYIWMVTGSYSSLSNSVLALIGISATTAVLGAVMDDTKQAQMGQQSALQTEKAALNPAVPADAARLQQISAQLAQMPQAQVTTHSFWRDILSDENGISFHRYQIVIWTLVLTVIFIVKVHVNLAMPDFDGQLLGLMGISSGTYLGFKFPEKKV